MTLLTLNHIFKNCGGPEVLTSTTIYKKCGVKKHAENGIMQLKSLK